MFSVEFDTSGLKTTFDRANIEAMKGAIVAVKFGVEELMKAATRNLMGVAHPPGTKSPYPGKLPVTRISRELSKSMKYHFFNPISAIVYSDLRSANYAAYVHDGTRRMKARPFLKNTVSERQQAILNRMRYETLKRVGR